MKSVFITYNQAFKDELITILDRMSIRGFTMWDEVQGRGNIKGEPHYGDHAWPTLNGAIIAIVDDSKVDALLERVHELDKGFELQGLHAFVWDIEKMV
jgi:nitrogen regulatory protein PII